MNISTLRTVMDGLMTRYTTRVPDVKKITSAMVEKELVSSSRDIENDHVAFRTLGIPNLGIASFEKIFMTCGYQKKDYFYFEGKKLDAYWYAPPAPNFPRIFLSELRVNDLSEKAQQIIRKYTKSIKQDPVDSLDLTDGTAIDAFLHSPLWEIPTLEDYETLQKESEYAAWVIYNRYYLNHYTISVHNLLNGYDDIYKYVEFLESTGIKLSDSGGKVKVSPDGGLLQTSTVAQLIEAEFADGKKQTIAGSYVEFAERKVLPEFTNLSKEEITREHRRDGFETANADKIFESTFSSQTKK
ncbi:MAG: hypothetical protein ACI9V1_003384 [Spirosomataceae bacterium]|jgi:hypothetical protein